MEVSHKGIIDVLQGGITGLKRKGFSQSFTIESAKETKTCSSSTQVCQTYKTFKILFNYLGPSVKNLVYIGSNAVGRKIRSETYIK